MSYVPTGIAAKAIEHLRQFPRGTERCSAELAEVVGEATGALAAFLKHSADRGWFCRRKQEGLLFWSLGPAAYGERFVSLGEPEHGPLPVRQTVIPSRDAAPEEAPGRIFRPEPAFTPPPPPAPGIPCARGVRLTIAAGRGLLIRDGVVVHLSDAQTAFLLAAVDGVGVPS